MEDTSPSDPFKLIGEDFYKIINAQYGKPVEKILRFFDVDSFFLLAAVREHDLLPFLETPNDVNTSKEAIDLKKEVCYIIDNKLSLKIGTKQKILVLLKLAKDMFMKGKRMRSFSDKSSNYHQNQQSTSESDMTIGSDMNENDLDLQKHRSFIEQEIVKLLVIMNNQIHGVTHDNITFNDFKIDIKKDNENDGPTCLIECICGDRVKMYFRMR